MRTFKKERAPLTIFICLLMMVFMALNHQSCKDPERIVSVTTDEVRDVSYTSCVLKGTLIDLGEYGIGGYGWCYSTETEPTVDDLVKNLGEVAAPGTYTDTLTFLLPNTTYYVRAYAQDKISAHYGEQLSFTTLEQSVAALTTIDVSEITSSSANSGGNISNDGGAPVTQRGVCWAIHTDPEYIENGDVTNDGSGSDPGSFSSMISSLEQGREYFVRAYAINSVGIGYGNELSFSTLTNAAVPTVMTNTSASDVTSTAATVTGSVENDGGAAVSEKGIVYGINTDPEVDDGESLIIKDGSGLGGITADLTGLTPETVYYARAYALNSEGYGYGDEISFTTLRENTLPTVSTSPVKDITLESATVGGDVTDDGGSEVTERGVWVSLTPNAEITGTKIIIGSGTGDFFVFMALNSGVEYYVKAFATNIVGTAYGNEESFQTFASVPINMITSNADNIGPYSATIGGDATPEVGITVTETGIWYSTDPNPEVFGTKIITDPLSLSFSINLSGLTQGTSYYYKAYAKCDLGTVFGDILTFQTTIPTVTDINGNVYPIVTIGTQTWMAENLKVLSFPDDVGIPYVETNQNWSDLVSTDMAYCYVDGDPANTDEFGLLYSWAAAMNGAASSTAVPSGVQGVCPDGWHLPSDAEWDILIASVGGEEVAGGKLREAGTVHWSFPNTGGTDDYGFTALPASYRYHVGTFGPVGNNAYFWTSTQSAASSAWYKYIYYNSVDVTTTSLGMDSGVSVRCVKD
ncbi:fibrobacter succinogenes major paralogous domain-containing protein [Bacteroidota bacterium]